MPNFCHAILTSKVGQTNLVFGEQMGFISRSVHARPQVSVCNGYNLCHHGTQTHRQHFISYYEQVSQLSYKCIT